MRLQCTRVTIPHKKQLCWHNINDRKKKTLEHCITKEFSVPPWYNLSIAENSEVTKYPSGIWRYNNLTSSLWTTQTTNLDVFFCFFPYFCCNKYISTYKKRYRATFLYLTELKLILATLFGFLSDVSFQELCYVLLTLFYCVQL